MTTSWIGKWLVLIAESTCIEVCRKTIYFSFYFELLRKLYQQPSRTIIQFIQLPSYSIFHAKFEF